MQDGAQIGTVDEFHDHRVGAVYFFETFNADDVGVLQAFADVRLVAEHLYEVLVLCVVGEDALDGADTLKPIVANELAEKNLSHAAASNAFGKYVSGIRAQ